jgi:hypothetical protein
MTQLLAKMERIRRARSFFMGLFIYIFLVLLNLLQGKAPSGYFL